MSEPGDLHVDLTAAVAFTENRVIGKGGGVPWHLPADLAHLKRCSIGRPNIMGRKVFDSLGGKALPERSNIVMTRQADYAVPNGVLVAHSPQEALELACAELSPTDAGQGHEIVILGGEEIYRLYLDDLTRVEQTIIHTELEGDTFFPALPGEWDVVRETFRPRDERNAYDLTFQTLVRRS